MSEVSVVVIVRNEELFIKNCIEGILGQSFTDFELIIVDDCSTDKTSQIIGAIKNPRIKCIRNYQRCGIAKSRNIGVNAATGKFVFLTDADCIPNKYWVEEGLKVFKKDNCLGLGGKTFYAIAKTTISDRVIEKLNGLYHGANNMAYTKEIIDRVGGFDLAYNMFCEDQDIAFRIMKYGTLSFSENMVVVHQQKRQTIGSLFRDAERAKSLVSFIKTYPHFYHPDIFVWKIAFPKKLLLIACPFLLIFYHSYKSWYDLKLMPFMYLSALYIRLVIWKEALKQKVFIF